MSAPEPLEHRILASLVVALEGIDGSSEYHHTVKTVSTDLMLLTSLPADRCPALLVVPELDGAARNYLMGSTKVDTYAVLIEGRVDGHGLLMGARVRAFTELLLDIEYALTRDQSRGGIAVETQLHPPMGPYLGIGTDPQVHFQQRVTVTAVAALGER